MSSSGAAGHREAGAVQEQALLIAGGTAVQVDVLVWGGGPDGFGDGGGDGEPLALRAHR